MYVWLIYTVTSFIVSALSYKHHTYYGIMYADYNYNALIENILTLSTKHKAFIDTHTLDSFQTPTNSQYNAKLLGSQFTVH